MLSHRLHPRIVDLLTFAYSDVSNGAQMLLVCRVMRQDLMTARKNIFPYLQAEQDMRYQKSRERWDKWEAEVMSDVKGWEVGKCVYKTREWMPPMPKIGASAYYFD
jgi:hypothetical protein